MASTLAQAYVQILPSTKGLGSSLTSEMNSAASEAGNKSGATLGASMVGMIKKAVVAAGIGTFIKSSLDAGGALQQSFGGLDTIYGEASEAAKEYAYAAQQAGISANDYAEQAVSFGASLKQAFAGDTTKAVEAANTAIMDMTDNAAKMGTPIENIQNAYQGFAKQNYTMLDNLKLGYGGTKTEMERLLADAQKLSGVEYNIDNLGDVYEAIHVIQGELGLTGVAAQEASETFTGSMGAMKAAWDNLLANISTGGDIMDSLNQVIGNAIAFVQNNMIPMLGNVLEGLPELLRGMISGVIRMINATLHNNPQMIQAGIDMILSLVESIGSALPYLLETALRIVDYIAEALLKTDWAKKLTNFAQNFIDAMEVGFGESFGADSATEMIQILVDNLTDRLSEILDVGIEIIQFLLDGIVQNLPTLVSAGMEIMLTLYQGLIDNIGTIINAIVEVLPMLIEAIVEVVPDVVIAIVEAFVNHAGDIISGIIDIVAVILEHLPEIIVMIVAGIGEIVIAIVEKFSELGPELIAKSDESVEKIKESFKPIVEFFKMCWENIKTTYSAVGGWFKARFQAAIDGIKSVFANIGQFFVDKWNAIKKVFSDAVERFKEIGKNIIDGLKNGISDAWESLTGWFSEKIGGLIDGAKDILGINSPSKEFQWIGEMVTAGFDRGIEDFGDEAISQIDNVVKSAEEASASLNMNAGLDATLASGSIKLSNGAYNQAQQQNVVDILSRYLPQIANKEPVQLSANATGLFNVVNSENRKNVLSTGYNAFA